MTLDDIRQRWDGRFPVLEAAIANAPTDIAYLLKRIELAEAVIENSGFNGTSWKAPCFDAFRVFDAIDAWREVAQ